VVRSADLLCLCSALLCHALPRVHLYAATLPLCHSLPFSCQDVILAVAGGGLFPARVLRTFLKRPSLIDPAKMRNVPISVVSLALYEESAASTAGTLGKEVVRTQWLDAKAIRGARGVEEGKGEGLLGKNILIVVSGRAGAAAVCGSCEGDTQVMRWRCAAAFRCAGSTQGMCRRCEGDA